MSEVVHRRESGSDSEREEASRSHAVLQHRHRAMSACLVALLLAGFALALTSLAKHAKTDSTLDLEDAAAWRSGDAMRAVDRAIDVPYAAAWRRVSAAVRYRLFGDLGPQVNEGCPGWLFYTNGLRPPPQTLVPGAAQLQAQIAAMRRYADALRRQGVTLVVATVPDKARVETGALCGLHQDARMTSRWNAWHDALASAGVAQVDLLGPLKAAAPSFYRTDVHWNARGPQAAADALPPQSCRTSAGEGPRVSRRRKTRVCARAWATC